MPSFRALETVAGSPSGTIEIGPPFRLGLQVDAIRGTVVDVIVELHGAGRCAAGAWNHEDAPEIEAVIHQPALRLALDGVSLRGRALRNEEDFPPKAQHHFVDACDGGGIHRTQGGPEVGRGADHVPHDVVAPPDFSGGEFDGLVFGIVRGARGNGSEEPGFDLVVRGAEVGQDVVPVEADAEK